MSNAGKVFLAIATAVTAAAIALAIKRIMSSQLSAIPSGAIRHKDELTLADIVMYFKNLDLDKTVDTPFVSKNLDKYKVKLPEIPQSGEQVLLVGVYEEKSDILKDYIIVYSQRYDEALQEVLAKAVDDVVALS